MLKVALLAFLILGLAGAAGAATVLKFLVQQPPVGPTGHCLLVSGTTTNCLLYTGTTDTTAIFYTGVN